MKRLATRAVALKAIVDDATFKKKALRDALLRLQEALERRRAEEERLRLQAEEEERRAAAAEAARLRAEEAARLAAVAHRQQLAFATGGLVLGVATAMFVRSARHHPVLDAALDAARRPLHHLWAAASRSRVGRTALVAARRGLAGVSHGAAALGRGLGGVLLQAHSVGALDSDVRVAPPTRLLEEASRRAAPCESSILDGLTLVAGGAAAVGGVYCLLPKPKAAESVERQDKPEEARAPEPEEEEDADVHMPNPTLRGVVSPPMAPFMASAAARPLPPAPRQRALPVVAPVTPALPPPPPPVAVVTPDSEEPRAAESARDEEPAEEVEEEDAIVEVTQRPARRGYPEPAFEGLEALRARPADYHELAAVLIASAGVSIEGGDRPLLEFRRDLISSARVAAVTITASKTRNRNIEIDEDGSRHRRTDGSGRARS